MLRRKITNQLIEWKKRENHRPLIIGGARQVGKTHSIRDFAQGHYRSVIEINFALQKAYRRIFDQSFEVDDIIKEISAINPDFEYIPHETLFFFDELQDCPNCATSLKSFHLDGRFDVICSGSLMGIHYKEIDSNSVGYKEDLRMHAMDFEEFLWAKGYNEDFIETLFVNMRDITPLSDNTFEVINRLFMEYILVGGMPEIVNMFVRQNTFNDVLLRQRQLLRDYEDDITKYARDLDKAKILSIYRHIAVFLGKENKKFQVSKVAVNARSREYVGVTEWLTDANIAQVCYCLDVPELPLGGNYNPTNYKLYYHDTGMLIASLDQEAQEDLYINRNFNTYKGAIYENVLANMLVKQSFDLYFYRNEKSTLEMDFFVRDARSLVPIEMKARDGATPSLNNLLQPDRYPDIRYGIKFGMKNIGFNGKFYTFPYALAFLLRRFLQTR